MTEWFILHSARKHGIADEDIVHAYEHFIRVFMFDDLVMLVGPDRATRLLEIGVSIHDGTEYIIHAMPARARFTD